MRFKALEISGFRAFKGNHSFDLDADIVLVVGVNGQGKTSFFDAILWAITGEIPRLERSHSVESLYSLSGEARVEVTMVSDDNRTIVVTRQSKSQRTRLQVRVGADVFRDEDGEYQLIRHLWPAGLSANDSRTALRSALQHGVYLQQDVLTGFLTAETDQQRFNVVSEFIGVGAATELQLELENSRRSWSRVTNLKEAELKETEGRLAWLEGQLQELGEDELSVNFNSEEWTAWWTNVKHFGVAQIDIPDPATPEAHNAVDSVMADLRAIRFSYERRREDLQGLETTFLQLPSAGLDLEELNRVVERSEHVLAIARGALSDAEAIVTNARRLEAEARSEREEIMLLAGLALRHLGEICPVCLQTYDKDGTRQRLEALRQSNGPSINLQDDLPDLANLERQVQDLEREAFTAAIALQQAQRQQQLRTIGQDRLRIGLAEFAVNVPIEGDVSTAIQSALEENARQLESLSEVRVRGESIALSLARSGQLARRRELEQEVLRVRGDLELARSELAARQSSWELATGMIEGIRHASSELVESELARLETLLQRIYATVDPHPHFRIARLLSRMRQGHGRIVAEVEDPINDLRNDTPSSVLSSSQMNVLAVAVFLTLNLGTHTQPLKTAILDDPLQSLDDLNLLGLIDLLKRIREQRQLMVSTHDSRFAALLERKLRPVSPWQRTIRVDLSGWSSEGSITNQRDVVGDPIAFKIAAA